MGFADWAAKQQAAGKAAEAMLAERKAERAAVRVTDRFEGITLTPTTVTHDKTTGPVRGATARVELGADIGKRVTATRLVTMGVFAFAAKKRAGHVFLTIEGDGYQIAVEVPAKHEAEARTFAAKVNAAARK